MLPQIYIHTDIHTNKTDKQVKGSEHFLVWIPAVPSCQLELLGLLDMNMDGADRDLLSDVVAAARQVGFLLDKASAIRAIQHCRTVESTTCKSFTLPATFQDGVTDPDRPIRYGLWSKKDRHWHQLLEHAFQGLRQRTAKEEVSCKCYAKNGERKGIPKIIHHIWLGPPCPDRFQNWMLEWRQKHPDWQYILWDEANIATLKLDNVDAFEAAPNFGEKSDIARYEILLRHG